MRENFKKILLLLLLSVTVVSYADRFNSFDDENYVASSISNYVYLLTALSFLLCASINQIRSNKHIRVTFFCLVIITINTFLTEAIFHTSVYWSDMKNIGIPFIALCIGYSVEFNKKFLLTIFYVYGLLMLGVCFSLIMNNIGGFIIADTYQVTSKNALGVMMSSYIAVILPLLLDDDIKKIHKIFFLGICAMFFVILMTIRARASTMTFFFTVFIFVFEMLKHAGDKHSRLAKRIITICVVLLIALPFLSNVFEPLGNYLHNSLFQNVEDDVTTGRMDRNEVAVEFIKNNLLLGRLSTPSNFAWVHNYVLRVLAEYGVFFSAILLYLYFYFVVKIMKLFLRKNPLQFDSIGFWATLPPIMLSFVEPLFPYGPGTSVLLTFLLLGYSLKRISLEQ